MEPLWPESPWKFRFYSVFCWDDVAKTYRWDSGVIAHWASLDSTRTNVTRFPTWALCEPLRHIVLDHISFPFSFAQVLSASIKAGRVFGSYDSMPPEGSVDVFVFFLYILPVTTIHALENALFSSYPVSFGSHNSHKASWSTWALKLLSGLRKRDGHASC